MTDTEGPRILLLGAGHANLLAVAALRERLPSSPITIIDAAPQATYSGMFPGYIAGHYDADDLRVDPKAFANRHKINFVRSRVIGLDPAAHLVELQDRAPMTYDLAALDVGSHSAMPEIPGFMQHAVPIKPLDGFAERLANADPAAPIAIIGGGVAGAEIALALGHRQGRQITVFEAGPKIAATLGHRARAHLAGAMDRAGIRTVTNALVMTIEDGAVVMRDGQRVPSAMTVGVAGARAHAWMAQAMPVDAGGFVRVTPTLQVEGCPSLFAVGDCAAMTHAPRPKAGVYAVRQAPVLAHNLIATWGNQTQQRYDPQRDYLKIISLGGKTALAEWRGLTLNGAWLWRWKDRIDRRFMATLQG